MVYKEKLMWIYQRLIEKSNDYASYGRVYDLSNGMKNVLYPFFDLLSQYKEESDIALKEAIQEFYTNKANEAASMAMHEKNYLFVRGMSHVLMWIYRVGLKE